MQPRALRPDPAGLLLVALAVVLFATSPVLIRLAAPLSAWTITFGRMAVAALLVAALARWRGERLWPPPFRWYWCAAYGLTAALHFLLYIASLAFTSVAHSLTLVYTAPLFVTLFAALFLGEVVPRRALLGLPVTVAGVTVLTGFEPAMDGRMLLGDLLALGSAVCFGLYSVIGRSARTRTPLLVYAAWVYGVAALWLLGPALLAGLTWPGWRAVLAVVALGVFPLGIGHTLYNAGLRRTHPTYVNLVATQEVTGGIVLSALILGEIPGLTAVVGALVTLVGVALVIGLAETAATGRRPADSGIIQQVQS